MHNVFTYGTLMFPQVFQRVVSRHYSAAPATAKHLQRSLMRHQDYPVVVPNRLAPELQGVVYFGVQWRDLLRLDMFEGDYYRRQTIRVQLAEHKTTVHAEVYMLRRRYRHLATGQEWSQSRFQREHLQRFFRTYCRR